MLLSLIIAFMFIALFAWGVFGGNSSQDKTIPSSPQEYTKVIDDAERVVSEMEKQYEKIRE